LFKSGRDVTGPWGISQLPAGEHGYRDGLDRTSLAGPNGPIAASFAIAPR